MINLIVTGSRENLTAIQMMIVRNMMERIFDAGRVDQLIIGDCPTGVDAFVVQWAADNQIKPKVFEANWKRLGKSAGPKRNQQMIDFAKRSGVPSFCVGFPGKKSKGTWDCLSRAQKAGIVTHTILL